MSGGGEKAGGGGRRRATCQCSAVRPWPSHGTQWPPVKRVARTLNLMDLPGSLSASYISSSDASCTLSCAYL
jgi:hypothetical protein